MTTSYAQLDRETRDYLAAVKSRGGKGSPGLFIAGSTNPWPALGCLLGGMLIILVLSLMLSLPKSAWAVAMLVTAGLWLGGWLVAYPLRRWFGSRLGTFTYFDPHTVYQVNADDITVTDITDMSGLDLTHQTANNSYTHSELRFKLPGRKLIVYVKNKRGAEKVDEYYQNLGEIEADSRWSRASPAEQGAAAVYVGKTNEIPQDAKMLDLEIDMPETEPAGKASGSGMGLRYLVLLAAGAVIFLSVWQFLKPTQDHEAFKEAQIHGVAGYRDYLLDDRNTRHRTEAKAKIKELYQAKIEMVKRQAITPEYQDALVALLENLAECEGPPVVSIRVKETFFVAGDTSGRERDVRTGFSDALGTYLGPEFIAFVECPPEMQPHFELSYATTMQGVATWQLAIRTTPEATAFLTPWKALPQSLSPPAAATVTAYVFRELFGIEPPAVQNLPIGGGDFDE